MQYASTKFVIARRVGILFSIFALWSGNAFANADSCTGQCCTHTQSGWDGPNPGGLLLAGKFAVAYPGGFVEVGIPGAAGFSIKFTSASAIALYLPASGSPNDLNADAVNPTITSAGAFGGQVLALQLNVDFNDANLFPGATHCRYGDLLLADAASPLFGKSVREILAIAHKALGGGNVSAYGVNIAKLNLLLEQLNGAFAECTLPIHSDPPVSLQQLMVSNGSLISGDKKFANFFFVGDPQINPADIYVELPALSGGCLGLRFRGGMVAFGDAVDFGLRYSVETISGLPLLTQIGQSFTYSGSGNGGLMLIGETVWLNNFFSGLTAQSSIGFSDMTDAPGEPIQGDDLIISPPANKVWVTKDVLFLPADAHSSVKLKSLDQVFCDNPLICCKESGWAKMNLTRIICPKDKKVDCNDSWDFHPPTVAPGHQVIVDMISTVTNELCGSSFEATRTWEVTDACGNKTICSQTVTVETDLDIDCASDKTVECGASWDFDEPEARSCDGDVDVEIVYTVTNYLPDGSHQVTRKWKVQDSCGNEDSCKQIVTVLASAPPQIGCGHDKVVECGSKWKFDPPSAFDAAIVDTVTNGVCGETFTVTRTWEVSDRCGNRVQCSQKITLVDTVAPILLKCPTNLVVECHAVPDPARVFAADPVSEGPGEQILLNSNNIVGGSGSLTNTPWNDSGSAFNAFHIVDDQTGPISERIPPNFWLGREGHLTKHIVIDLGKPYFIDRIELFNTHDHLLNDRRTKDFQISAANDVIDAGINGLDLAGNVDLILSNRLSFHVAKDDPIEPDTFTDKNGLMPCAAYRYLRFQSLNGYGHEGVGLNEIRIFGMMVCDPDVKVSFDEVRADGACPQDYKLTRTWTATDACGNSSRRKQTITVHDTMPPALTCPLDQQLPSALSIPVRPANLLDFLAAGGSASDLCDTDLTNLTYVCTDGPLVAVLGDGKIERKHIVFDACGNSNSCVQVFSISDSIPPLAMPLPLSRLSIYVAAESGWVILQWDAVPLARYGVQYKDDLPSASWTTLPGDVYPEDDLGMKLDTFYPEHRRFYRVVRLPE